MNNGLKNAIKAEMECRSQRYRTIPADLLGEPVWDILLDLGLSYLEGKRIQITAAGLGAGLAPTTSLRSVCRLEERGLIRRIPDPDDGRRTWLEILPETMAKLAACFGYHWEREGEPVSAGTSAEAGTAESRGIFFQGGPEAQRRLSRQFLPPEGAGGAKKSKSLLLKRATDWINQDYDERLSFAAQALYVHGYLSPHEYRRIEQDVREDAEGARNEKVRARREAQW